MDGRFRARPRLRARQTDRGRDLPIGPADRAFRSDLPTGPADRAFRPDLPTGPADRAFRSGLPTGPVGRVVFSYFLACTIPWMKKQLNVRFGDKIVH